MRGLMVVRGRQVLLVLAVSALALLLYLPFRSERYDGNGLTEARAVEAGGGQLLNPNHLLYRPIGFVVYEAALARGYQGRAVYLLQVVTALFSAVGVGLCFALCYRLGGSLLAALASTLLLACSWSYWYFSTDVSYITLSALFAILALQAAIGSRSSFAKPLAAGLFAALATLAWQASIFLLPVVAIIVSAPPTIRRRREGIRTALIAGLGGASLLGATYAGAWVAVGGQFEPGSFVRWATSYESPLPMWGQWSPDRTVPLAVNAVASWVPVWKGLGLRDLLAGQPRLDRFLNLVAAACLVALGLVVGYCAHAARASPGRALTPRPVWLLLGYLAFVPFIFWWDPYEPRWFIVPNIFACLSMAIILGARRRDIRPRLACLGLVLVIGAANFTSTIYPQSVGSSPGLSLAECFARNTGERDALLSTRWGLDAYLGYFQRRDIISLIDIASKRRDAGALMSQLEVEIRAVEQRGGRVYMVSLDSVSDDHLSWLEQQTQMTRFDLERYRRETAFTCQQTLFEAITHLGGGR